MEKQRVSWLPLPPDWNPESVALQIHDETEKWWKAGWVFERAETDALLQSVCLYFRWPEEKAIFPPPLMQ